MAKQKSKIISLLQPADSMFEPGAVFFPVNGHPRNKAGEVCADADGNPIFPPVESIMFCRHAYGQGAVVDQPCYIVSFVNSQQVVAIAATQMCQITIHKTDADDNSNIPALPEE